MRKNKPDLLALHGYRGAPIGIEQITERLKQHGYKVYTPAVPPFAGAEPLAEYTPRAYADFVKEFIEKNHLDRPVLIGHSMGSIVAAATAEQYPDLINQKIILLSPISKRTPRALSLLSVCAAYLPRKVVDYVTTKFLYVARDPKKLREILDLTDQCTRATRISRREMAKAGRFSADHGILDFNLKKQTLLLAGVKDRLVSKKDTKKLTKKLGAELVFLENTGHIHNYEQPEETATEIIRFLEKEP